MGLLALQWQQACNIRSRAPPHGGVGSIEVSTQRGGRQRLHKKQDKTALAKGEHITLVEPKFRRILTQSVRFH